MSRYWSFPATIGGFINSINNAGLETFKGNPLGSLTREICQNSLDAVRDVEKPVIVEFSDFSIENDTFPGHNDLVNAFGQCNKTWSGKNKDSELFINRALQILMNDEIKMLRISDFNTRGLEGAKNAELGSAWSALIREAGSSNKGDSSGGSFGIGKSAPFLNSKLRTLFYSTFDITGYESHIGVANIMSFHLPDNSTTIGSGYYTNNETSSAILGQLLLDSNFQRNEPGTDVYVTAFEPQGNWEQEIINSVLNNFFITVLNKKLVVKINDFIIDDRNIASLINDLKDTNKNRVLKQYCEVLTSENTIKIPYPEKSYKNNIRFAEGEAELYLLNGEDLNRRVLMTRNTGMKIFDQSGINGSISFTGILRITGPNMNVIFKEMENPEHNKWEPKRFEEDPKLAEEIYSDLRRFMREVVVEQFQEEVSDEMDAVGLNDFLPNKNLVESGTDNKQESLTSTPISVVNKDVDQKKRKIRRRRTPKGQDLEEIEEQLTGDYGITPTGEEGGQASDTDTGGDDAGGGIGEDDGVNELDDESKGDINKKRKKRLSSRPIPMNQRYMCVDKEKGKYRFNITPPKDIENGRLVFSVIGEQSDYKLPILSAKTNDHNVTINNISANTVNLESLKKNQDFTMEVRINYSNYCVLEAVLYEN